MSQDSALRNLVPPHELDHTDELLVSAIDLVAVTGYAVVAAAAIVLGVVDGPFRVFLAALLLGFAPGYGVVAALFPTHTAIDDRESTSRLTGGPTWVARLSLAVATSMIVLVLASVALSLVGAPFDAFWFSSVAVAVALVGSVVGVLRRVRLPVAERFTVPLASWAASVRAGIDTRPFDAVLNVALALALVVALTTVAFGLTSPDRGEAYTEVALLDDRDGDLVAGNYTTTLREDEPMNVTLTVQNREGETVEYVAVVVIERLDAADGDEEVLERDELDRVALEVEDERTAERPLSVRPTMLGENLRLNVFVYEGSPPAEPATANADYHLYLWTSVEPTASENGTSDRASTATLSPETVT